MSVRIFLPWPCITLVTMLLYLLQPQTTIVLAPTVLIQISMANPSPSLPKAHDQVSDVSMSLIIQISQTMTLSVPCQHRLLSSYPDRAHDQTHRFTLYLPMTCTYPLPLTTRILLTALTPKHYFCPWSPIPVQISITRPSHWLACGPVALSLTGTATGRSFLIYEPLQFCYVLKSPQLNSTSSST